MRLFAMMRRAVLGLAALVAAGALQPAAAQLDPCSNLPGCDGQGNNYDMGVVGPVVSLAAASSGSPTADQPNYNWHGLACLVNVTAITAGSLTVTIQGKDVASGAYFTLLSSTALTTTGAVLLQIYPGLAAVANQSASMLMPRLWRISPVIATGPVTATVGCNLIN